MGSIAPNEFSTDIIIPDRVDALESIRLEIQILHHDGVEPVARDDDAAILLLKFHVWKSFCKIFQHCICLHIIYWHNGYLRLQLILHS